MSVSRETIVLLQGGALTAVAGAAALWDIRSRRIPNALVVSGVLLAFLLRLGLSTRGVLEGLEGMGLALAVGLSLYALRVWGAGDGKLLVVMGAFLGLSRLPGAMLLIALLGGLMAVFEAGRRGVIVPALLNVRRLFTTVERRRLQPHISLDRALTLPYGVPIALGAVLWWFLGGTWP